MVGQQFGRFCVLVMNTAFFSEGKPLAELGNPNDYAYQALDYYYTHMKFPDTMEVLSIRCGEYDRVSHYDGAPDWAKPSGTILDMGHQYFMVQITIRAANSFGALTTSTYVSLFDITSGKTYHDLVGYAESMADGAWGSRKLEWMDVKSEALILAASVNFPELTREEIQSLVDMVRS